MIKNGKIKESFFKNHGFVSDVESGMTIFTASAIECLLSCLPNLHGKALDFANTKNSYFTWEGIINSNEFLREYPEERYVNGILQPYLKDTDGLDTKNGKCTIGTELMETVLHHGIVKVPKSVFLDIETESDRNAPLIAGHRLDCLVKSGLLSPSEKYSKLIVN